MLPLEGSAGYEEKTTGTNTGSSEVEYNEDNIRHLDDMEHIRVRSGMYIGRLGDGSQNDDGIYVLLKEVMDNSIDEFKMGAGKRIEVNIEARLGPLSELETKLLVNLTPSFAMRSRLGVSIYRVS